MTKRGEKVKTYRTAMTAFGLDRGDTFESADPRWEDHVKAGNVTRVDDNTVAEHEDETGGDDAEQRGDGE